MPEKKNRYKRRFGDRYDGRRIRTLDPLFCIEPYILKSRNTSANMFAGTIDITEADRYIREKRMQGMPGLGILHLFIASYVRILSQRPALNRFISGQKIYARFGILVNLTVKKSLTVDGQETTVKAVLDPSDTIDDVYRKMQEAVQEGKQTGDSNDTDKTARILRHIPGLFLKFLIWLLSVLDYFGILPKALIDISPFHGSIFISDLGSVSLPPVFHHLYDFGNIPVFLCFGPKYRKTFTDKSGHWVEHRYFDFKVTIDERICDGFYFSGVLKLVRDLFEHPQQLDTPPEKVVEDIE